MDDVGDIPEENKKALEAVEELEQSGFSFSPGASGSDVSSEGSGSSPVISDSPEKPALPASGPSTKHLDDSVSEHVAVSPNLLLAYGANLLKVLFMFGVVIAAYFIAFEILGQNPFEGVLSEINSVFDINITFDLVVKVVAGVAGLIFFLAILDTTSLTTKSLVIDGDDIVFSYGGFFKVSRQAKIEDIIRINYKGSLFGVGTLEAEFSGTEEKSLKIPFVISVGAKCDRINALVRKKRKGLDIAMD